MTHRAWTEFRLIKETSHCSLPLSHTGLTYKGEPCDEHPLTHHKINNWGGSTVLSVCELKGISRYVSTNLKSRLYVCKYFYSHSNWNNSHSVCVINHRTVRGTRTGSNALNRAVRIPGEVEFSQKSTQHKNNYTNSLWGDVMYQSCCLSRGSYLSLGWRVLQCAVKLSGKSRQEGGHTSPTSQEQWAVFSWITVASSPSPSHWSAPASPFTETGSCDKQEGRFHPIRGTQTKVTHFQSDFLWLNQCSHLLAKTHNFHTHTHAHTWTQRQSVCLNNDDCLCYHESVTEMEIYFTVTCNDILTQHSIQVKSIKSAAKEPCRFHNNTFLHWILKLFLSLRITAEMNSIQNTKMAKASVTEFSAQR